MLKPILHWGAFVGSLCLTNQHTSIQRTIDQKFNSKTLLIVAIPVGFTAIEVLRSKTLRFGHLVRICVIGLFTLCIYLIFPENKANKNTLLVIIFEIRHGYLFLPGYEVGYTQSPRVLRSYLWMCIRTKERLVAH